MPPSDLSHQPHPYGDKNQVADAAPGNWVDRFAPRFSRPYLRLMRADRPIGVWLLLWPCWWSLGLAGLHQGQLNPDLWYLFLFAVGAIAMRGAGCTYNDLIDRDIDARVERTKSRPLPSGAVTPLQATIFLGFLCLIGLLVLLQFNLTTIALGVSSLFLVAVYPFMKRVTSYPQIVLGLAFSWGALMGWSALLNGVDWPALLLFAAAVFWTVGYDTIYAHQDKEDDALLGLGSTALAFGRRTRLYLGLLYGAAFCLLTLAGWVAGGGLVFIAVMGLAALHLAWQVATVDIDNADNCLARFKSNRDLGAIVFLAIVAQMVVTYFWGN